MNNPCIKCPCWDSDRKVCTMPQSDMWYACQIKPELPENKKALEQYAEWLPQYEGEWVAESEDKK